VSKGPGRVQRQIAAAFEAEPSRRFTIEELASAVYPGEAIERSHKVAVRRALKSVGPTIGLHTCRVGQLGKLGWRHVVGVASL
jgi:hypothetical protein